MKSEETKLSKTTYCIGILIQSDRHTLNDTQAFFAQTLSQFLRQKKTFLIL